MAFPFRTSAFRGECLFHHTLCLQVGSKGAPEEKISGFQLFTEFLSYRMTLFHASGQELDHSIFYRPAKFTNLTPLVI